MIEISKNESIAIRKFNSNVVIRQTVKSKNHRGKYFMEETSEAMNLLAIVRNCKRK